MGYAFIRAHFDGKVIVPDEPVDWPINQPLSIQAVPVDAPAASGAGSNEANGTMPSVEVIAERLAKLRAISGRLASGGIPDEALRRENLYEDRG